MQLINIIFLLTFLLAKVIPPVFIGYHINDYRSYLSTGVINPFNIKYDELLEFFSDTGDNSLIEKREKERLRRIVISTKNFEQKVNRVYIPLSVILIILNIYPF